MHGDLIYMHSLDRVACHILATFSRTHMQRAHKVTPQIDVSKNIGPACSGNAMSLVLAIGIAALVAASASADTSHGNVFYVGDKDGWVSKPTESYDRWAARHRFTVTDTLGTNGRSFIGALL
jgi:hypothetical protein